MPGRRGTAGHWVARIGIGIVPILTIGLLGWVPALVAAIRTRRTVDRVLVAVSAGVAIVGLAMLISVDTSEEKAAREAAGQVARAESPIDDIGMIMLIVLMIAMPVHWFVRAARWPRLMQGQEPPAYVPWHARPPVSPTHGGAAQVRTQHHPSHPSHPSNPNHPSNPSQASQASQASHRNHPAHPSDPNHPTIALTPPRTPPPPAAPPNPPPLGAGSRIPQPPAPRSTPPLGSTPPAGSTPPPGTDDPAARARARLQGLSERLREQDGGNPGGPR
ncbi:hypothetical protein GT354_05470 [Streptomyces sp. SID3343]|nr:hypothetical protein [Streptomyces sp. SID3343]